MWQCFTKLDQLLKHQFTSVVYVDEEGFDKKISSSNHRLLAHGGEGLGQTLFVPYCIYAWIWLQVQSESLKLIFKLLLTYNQGAYT